MIEYTPKFLARFWAKVDCTAGLFECWTWTAGTNHAGYGTINWNGHSLLAHRISYQLASGEFPDDLDVLHSCDNPPCVNPCHLFLGTNLDNVLDSKHKGRHKNPVLLGETNPQCKLTNEQVSEIRRLYTTGNIFQRELGLIYGVTQTQISHIVTGKAWRS